MQRKGAGAKKEQPQDPGDKDSSEKRVAKAVQKSKGSSSFKTFVAILGILIFAALCASIGWYVGGRWDALSDHIAEQQRQLYDACRRGHVDEAKRLLAEGASVSHRYGEMRSSLVEAAVSYGNAEILSLLLGKGADPSARNKGGTAALHLAGLCRGGTYHDSEPLSKTQHCQPMALDLLRAGADPNPALPETAVRPLHLFADQKAESVVRALLESGGDPNAVMADGSTALHVVGESDQDAARAAVIRLLLEFGADPMRRDQAGNLPAIEDAMGTT